MANTIKKITIEGFKSIRKLEEFPLGALNVLIGANGAGKSNFVGFFRLLRVSLSSAFRWPLLRPKVERTPASTSAPRSP